MSKGFLTAEGVRNKVSAKLRQIAEQTHDEELTTQHMLDNVCRQIVLVAAPGDTILTGPRAQALISDFEEEILDWVASAQGYAQSLDPDLPEAVTMGATMAHIHTFVGFQGRKCRVCEGLGCLRCDDAGFFDEPEPEQLDLF